MAAWVRAVFSIVGALVGLGCFAIAIARASSAPELAQRAHSSPADLAAAAQRLAASEPAWWASAERDFPGDRWSKYDHFHNLEQMAIRREATRLHVSVDRIVVAVDAELRSNPGDRRVGTAPCKPRPFYQ
jgi:hypothetical protein